MNKPVFMDIKLNKDKQIRGKIAAGTLLLTHILHGHLGGRRRRTQIYSMIFPLSLPLHLVMKAERIN